MLVSFLYWEARNWVHDSRYDLTSAEWRGKIVSLDVLSNMVPYIFGHEVILLTLLGLVHQEPRLFLPSCFRTRQCPACPVLGVILSQVKGFAFDFAELHEVPVSSFF